MTTAGGTCVGHKLWLVCGTFHDGCCDDVVRSYSSLCSEAGPLLERLMGLVLAVYRCRRYELGWVLDPDERFLCFGIFCCPVGSFLHF